MADAAVNLVNAALRLGYTVSATGGGHHKCVHQQTGAVVHLPSTPGRGRAWANSLRQLERGAGQDTRGRPAIIGERRDKPIRQRQPNHDHIDPEVVQRQRAGQLAQRQRELDGFNSIMRSRPGR